MHIRIDFAFASWRRGAALTSLALSACAIRGALSAQELPDLNQAPDGQCFVARDASAGEREGS